MTLLIALLLLHQIEAGVFAYIGTVLLWLFHIGYHASK